MLSCSTTRKTKTSLISFSKKNKAKFLEIFRPKDLSTPASDEIGVT